MKAWGILFHLITETELKTRRGQVTEERWRQIIAILNRANGWI
jgi:hypothetical protein